ncbi:MAG: hypothetical protein D3924_03765 [Candidatus Electrothrix sp. AR4]|nr:hypothetical protein [Candidatus Electrothrix sp. AR4]
MRQQIGRVLVFAEVLFSRRKYLAPWLNLFVLQAGEGAIFRKSGARHRSFLLVDYCDIGGFWIC